MLGSKIKPDGTRVIAPTQRADGSWRKEREVRDGHVPLEEREKYRPQKEEGTREVVGVPPPPKSKSARKNEARRARRKEAAAATAKEGGEEKKEAQSTP